MIAKVLMASVLFLATALTECGQADSEHDHDHEATHEHEEGHEHEGEHQE
tara:strand:+ start:86 stop:235 length:150 start_codon:yes stop_codon:yes gene_type:complete